MNTNFLTNQMVQSMGFKESVFVIVYIRIRMVLLHTGANSTLQLYTSQRVA